VNSVLHIVKRSIRNALVGFFLRKPHLFENHDGSAKRREELLLAGALVLVLLASVCIAPSELPHVVVCGFKRLTSLACPLCGLTRSFIAIGHGEWREAWRQNPFGFPLYGLASAWAVALLWKPYAPRSLASFFRELQLAKATAVCVVALCMYGIARAVS
jgi:hypothetical protein